MKKVLTLVTLLMVVTLVGCTKEVVMESPEIQIVEVPVIIKEIEVVYIDREVMVEVVPYGYVDSYYYCHEDEVYDLTYDMFEIIFILYESYEDIDSIEFVEEGYDGYPTLIMTIDGVTEEIDIWDIMTCYCEFEPYGETL